MIEASAEPTRSIESPEPVLDIDHLSRMTLGDRDLEREVLQLFDRQTAMLTDRLRGATPTVVASCAHTLKGSARGIGAWRLAQAAERVERVVAAGEPELPAVVEELVGAVLETRSVIAGRMPPN